MLGWQHIIEGLLVIIMLVFEVGYYNLEAGYYNLVILSSERL